MSRDEVLWADGLLVDVRQQADPSEQDAARNFAGIEQRLRLEAPSSAAANGAGNPSPAEGAGASAGTLLRLRPELAPRLSTPPASATSAASGWKSAAVLGRWLAFGVTSALLGYLGGRAESAEDRAELEQRRQSMQLARLQAQELSKQAQQGQAQQGQAQQGQALQGQALQGQALRLTPLQVQPPRSAAGSAALAAEPVAQRVRQAPSAEPLAAERHAQRAPAVLRAARSTRPPRAQTAKPSLQQPAEPKPNDMLREAIQLLSRAEAELREGDAFAASLLLSDLDRTAPAALLREERLATAVLVACALAQTERARDGLRELTQLNPESIYRARLEAACSAKMHAPVSKAPVAPH